MIYIFILSMYEDNNGVTAVTACYTLSYGATRLISLHFFPFDIPVTKFCGGVPLGGEFLDMMKRSPWTVGQARESEPLPCITSETAPRSQPVPRHLAGLGLCQITHGAAMTIAPQSSR
jgi:hypothetical protein